MTVLKLSKMITVPWDCSYPSAVLSVFGPSFWNSTTLFISISEFIPAFLIMFLAVFTLQLTLIFPNMLTVNLGNLN